MANINKKLKQALDACKERCQVHDEFMASIYEIARATLAEDGDAKKSLTVIRDLCSPEYRAEVGKPSPPKEERRGHVHGGEELRSKPEGNNATDPK